MVYPTIKLARCTMQWTDYGCITRYPDGSEIMAWPDDGHHSHVISHRCGYGDDTMAYCREHDFCHNFLTERLEGYESPILRGLAVGTPMQGRHSVWEEAMVQTFQRWLRGGERPILGGADWDWLKRDALALLRGAQADRAGVAIIVTDGEAVLLAKRLKQNSHVGKYAPPGGKTDPGETAVEAARRELYEEAGIARGPLIEMGDLVKTQPEGDTYHLTTFYLPVDSVRGTLVFDREPTKMGPWKWASRSDLATLAMIEEDRTSSYAAMDLVARAAAHTVTYRAAA